VSRHLPNVSGLRNPQGFRRSGAYPEVRTLGALAAIMVGDGLSWKDLPVSLLLPLAGWVLLLGLVVVSLTAGRPYEPRSGHGVRTGCEQRGQTPPALRTPPGLRSRR